MLSSLLLAVAVVSQPTGYDASLAGHLKRWLEGEKIPVRTVAPAQMGTQLAQEKVAFLVGLSNPSADEMRALLRELSARFKECAQVETPNFFALGYYAAQGKEIDPRKTPVAEMNALADKALDDYEEMDFYDYYGLLSDYRDREVEVNYGNLDEALPLLGDTNQDGIVTISDVTAIQRVLAELESFSDLQMLLADANQDGEVNITDATTIQKYLAEFDIPYPIGKPVAYEVDG